MEVCFGFKGPFSTHHINLVTKDVLPAGVYLAPGITDGQYQTLIITPPWVIRTTEGMTIREERSPIKISFSGDLDGLYFVGVRALYVVGGPAQVSVERVAQETYNNGWSDAQKASFVILCEVSVSGSDLIIRQIDRQAQPRGTFALQVDLLDVQGKSTIGRVAEWGDLDTLAQSSSIPLDRVFYVENKHLLAVFNGSGFDRVNPTFSGSSVFYDAPTSGPNPGVGIALDSSMPSTDPTSYTVIVTPTSDTGAHTGEIWVEKGVLGVDANLAYFTVKCSGRPNTLGGGTATFDYIVIPRQE
jgi:hypothetical protein